MITPKIHTRISKQSKILFVVADQNYSIFHLENGRQMISGYTLKFHENHLDLQQFIRVNRSTLINVSYMKQIKEKKNASYVKLKNGKNILISRRRLKTVMEQYEEIGLHRIQPSLEIPS